LSTSTNNSGNITTCKIHEQPGSCGGRQNAPADGRESQDWSSALQHDAGV